MPYIDKMYNSTEKPVGSYPYELCSYLAEKYEIQPTSKVLDVGAGRGDISRIFKRLDNNVYSCDIEKSDYHKDLLIHYFNTEEEWPYEQDFFDVVFAKSVLEHVKDGSHFIKEARRVLKPGGLLILLVPNWETQFKIFYDDPTHIRPYTAKTLDFTLKQNSLEVIYCREFFQYPIFWKVPFLKFFRSPFRNIRFSRYLTRVTGVKYFRWTSETMVLGVAKK